MAICSDETVPEALVMDLLVQLVAKSLVQVEPRPGIETRYHLLEPIRGYAGERLAEAGEGEGLRRRYRDWYVALAEQAAAALEEADRLDWLPRLRVEEDNLGAVLEECRASPDGNEPGRRLAAALAGTGPPGRCSARVGV